MSKIIIEIDEDKIFDNGYCRDIHKIVRYEIEGIREDILIKDAIGASFIEKDPDFRLITDGEKIIAKVRACMNKGARHAE